ncbi:hypothetical protein GOB94_15890 [Granulicella sp. 5B5]|nr:hypothetical protein GOB94_15890 [Granulicella sp. 5B5]
MTDLGANRKQGFTGISILRNDLKSALGSVEIIKNDYHGNYNFEPTIIIGECACEKLVEIGDRAITDLAAQIRTPVVPKKKI